MDLKYEVLYNMPYWQITILTIGYFLILYFGVGYIFNELCKWLYKKGWLNKIDHNQPSKKQVSFEIKNSLVSILIFGFSSLPVIYLVRAGYVSIMPDTFLNVIVGLVILILWNEIHFFVIHRLLHTPYLMRKVHYMHHISTTPTIYSIYSFHWFEALLLSTVPLSILWVGSFPTMVFALFPLIIIPINFAGHCNYRFGNGKGSVWGLFATRHNEHHTKWAKNYGFALFLLDKIYKRINKL